MKEFVKISSKELFDIIFISIVLSLLFSILFIRYESDQNLVFIFIQFLIFIISFYILQLFFIKFFAYKNGFEIFMYQTLFDRYYLKPWEKLSYHKNKISHYQQKDLVPKNHEHKEEGIPMSIIAIIIYILSLGFIIYPAIYNYKYKKIPHLLHGKKSIFENQNGALAFLFFKDVSDYRFANAIFAGFIFIFLFSILIKAFFIETKIYYWLLFIVYWIGFGTLIPIFGSPGFELFLRNRFTWISSISILSLGLFALLLFENIIIILLVSIICFLITTFIYSWKRLT